MTIISYLIFYNLSFLCGRSFLILISRLFKKDIKDKIRGAMEGDESLGSATIEPAPPEKVEINSNN